MENIERLFKELPPVVFRNNPRFREYFGVSPRTILNLENLGRGPERVKIGGLVGYPREGLIKWMSGRTSF